MFGTFPTPPPTLLVGNHSRLARLLVFFLTFLARLSSPDPGSNRGGVESEALTCQISDADTALLLAHYVAYADEVFTLVVDGIDEGEISGIDLADLGARRRENPFAALARCRIRTGLSAAGERGFTSVLSGTQSPGLRLEQGIIGLPWPHSCRRIF